MEENHPMLYVLFKMNAMNSTAGYVPPLCLPVWCEEPEPFYSSRKVRASLRPVARLEWVDESFEVGFVASMLSGLKGSRINPAEGESPLFPPEVALYLVKMACEMPDQLARSLSLWDCLELARKLEEDGIVQSISPETIRRVLNNHHLKPWRHNSSLGAKTPRDKDATAEVMFRVLYFHRTFSYFNLSVLAHWEIDLPTSPTR